MCESFFTDNKILIFRGNMASFWCPSGEEIGDLSKLVRITSTYLYHFSCFLQVNGFNDCRSGADENGRQVIGQLWRSLLNCLRGGGEGGGENGSGPSEVR